MQIKLLAESYLPKHISIHCYSYHDNKTNFDKIFGNGTYKIGRNGSMTVFEALVQSEFNQGLNILALFND